MNYLSKKIKSSNLQIISCLFFSLLGLQIKILSDDINIEIIVFFRSLLGSIILGLIILKKNSKTKNFFKTENFNFLFLRSVFGVLAMYFSFSALTLIPLAQASTIAFTKVFFVGILAIIFFKEKIKIETFLVSVIGFYGVYILTDPTQFENFQGTFFALIGSFFVALGIIITKFLSKKNSSLTILFYHSLFATIISFLFFFSYLKIYNFFFIEFLQLILITLTAITGQFFNVESYKKNHSNIIVVFGYTRVVFSFILGYIFLNEQLSVQTILGIILIILSTLFLSKRI